jgi:type III pantothenate kinase
VRLELDVGNTRTKWRLCDDVSVLESGQNLIEALAQEPWWVSVVEIVWVSSVVSEQNEPILALFPNALFAKSQVAHLGLINSYQDPNKMGVDRWLAMQAVWSQQPNTSHIIVDAGTAITLDVIDNFGRHVGGYICPGFSMMKAGLLGGTQRVMAQDNWQLGRELGNNTQGCVDYGIQDMVACWLESHRVKQPDACIWITGGDGVRLNSLLSSPVTFEADLVLDGLKVHFS